MMITKTMPVLNLEDQEVMSEILLLSRSLRIGQVKQSQINSKKNQETTHSPTLLNIIMTIQIIGELSRRM